MGEGAAKAEQGLFVASQDANAEVGRLPNHFEERGGVGRIAHGTRRHRFDARGANLPGERHHVADGVDGSAHATIAELAGLIETRPQPRMGAHLVHDADAAVGRDVRDDLSNGVRADVDGGDALGARLAAATIGTGLGAGVSGFRRGVRRQGSYSDPRSGA